MQNIVDMFIINGRSIVKLGIKRNVSGRSIERLWSIVHKITRA
jgi:hypothetical protein